MGRQNNNNNDGRSIIVLEVFSRSGGTLVNKCIGSLPDTIVISEVNRLGGGAGKEKDPYLTTVQGQADRWYGIELKAKSFLESILELNEFCITNKKNLVIRDWVYISFTGIKKNNYNPSKRLDTLEILSKYCDVIPVAFVRNSMDAWISNGCPNPDLFFASYKQYVQAIVKSKMKIFKYEDFVINPKGEMKKLCRILNLPYSDNFLNNYQLTPANGDTQLGNFSRGIR